MAAIREMLRQARADGFLDENAEAKVCQDIVLKALSESSLCRNATIKGGVVMRSITGDSRRATQDMDIDFIRYSISDDSIRAFILALDCLPGIHIVQTGSITELKQQDYHGKRVHVRITDYSGDVIESKIDLGVHKHLDLEQQEYCFDIAFDEKGVSLLINSFEQMYAEKLRSLLKFGPYSTRYKDIYDMFFHCNRLNRDMLLQCFEVYIFHDSEMREKNMSDIVQRVKTTFDDNNYRKRVDESDKRWIDDDIETIFSGIIKYLESLY